jgi:FkbM family methyltransferase
MSSAAPETSADRGYDATPARPRMANGIVTKLRRVARIQTRAAANAVAKRLPEHRGRTTYHGWSFTYPSRSIVGRAVAGGLVWDPHLTALVGELPEGGTVCEVGGNIGASLLTMAEARPDLRFVCFEPSPRFAPYLRENVELNGLGDRVEIEERLVGPGGGRFMLTSNTSTGSVVEGAYDRHLPVEASELQATALDDYFADRDDPDLVKVDTDGFELRVLESAREMLRRSHPVLFVEFTPALLRRVGDSPSALPALLMSVGYETADVYHGEGDLRDRDHPLSEPIETDRYVDLVVRPPGA